MTTEDLTIPRDVTLADAASGEFTYNGERYVKLAFQKPMDTWPKVVKVSNGVMFNADPSIVDESIPPFVIVQQAPWGTP